MNKYLIVANWKLNGSKKIISNFLKFLNVYLSTSVQKNTIVIAPSTIYLQKVSEFIDNKNFFLAAQNVDINLKGAFTGETSILMLKDIGVQYVIIGHSERRRFHHENNDIISKKFSLIKELNLTPILCIGETQRDKEVYQTKIILKKQLDCIFYVLGKKAFRNTVIAYEPIWSIGTGISADPKYVQLIHKFIKDYIKDIDDTSTDNLIIQYGGSVNKLNAKSFLKEPDINGLLVGSASLKCEDFIEIIDIANTTC